MAIISPKKKGNTSNTSLIWSTPVSATAQGATTLKPSLPGGATGRPVKIKMVSTVAAYATLSISNNQQTVIQANPNSGESVEEIPPNAFVGNVNSVTVVANLSAAGVAYISVGFVPA